MRSLGHRWMHVRSWAKSVQKSDDNFLNRLFEKKLLSVEKTKGGPVIYFIFPNIEKKFSSARESNPLTPASQPQTHAVTTRPRGKYFRFQLSCSFNQKLLEMKKIRSGAKIFHFLEEAKNKSSRSLK